MLIALVGSAWSGEVLLPDATPRSPEDLAIASMFTQLVVDAAREEGLHVEDADAIRAWAHAEADACWDAPACPRGLWDRTEARLAVVMRVGRNGTLLEVDVRLHGAEDPEPFKVLHERAAAGQEQALASRVAATVKEALPLVPERRLPASAPAPLPPAPPVAKVPRRPDPPPPPVEAPPPEAPPEVEPAAPVAKRTPPAKKAVASVRARKLFLELGGGWSTGDVDRGYGVRAGLQWEGGNRFHQTALSSWTGSGSGEAPTFWGAIGYAPAWFLDLSIAAGGQLGKKHLDTGWECIPAEDCEATSGEAPQIVDAAQLLVEPRARVHFVAGGVVKPYALFGFTVLYHDGYVVDDPVNVDYPDVDGGVSWGPTAGVGIAFDAVSAFSVFLEVPATLLVSGDELTSTDPALSEVPTPLDGDDMVLRFTGGITVRL